MAGPASPSIAWADATGAVIPHVYGFPPTLFDADGRVWKVEPATGSVLASGVDVIALGYASSDCSGPELAFAFLPSPPRAVFRTSQTDFFTLDDATTWSSTQVQFASSGMPGSCTTQPSGTFAFAVPTSELVPVNVPTPAGTAPFHPVEI